VSSRSVSYTLLPAPILAWVSHDPVTDEARLLTVRSHVLSSYLPAERMANHVTRAGALLSTKQSSAVAKGSHDGLLRWWILSVAKAKRTDH
jgi:hypothetical protein